MVESPPPTGISQLCPIGLVDSLLFEVWGTEVVVASYDDVLTFAEFHTELQLPTGTK